MGIDWEAVRTFWNGSGWEYLIIILNGSLAYYAFVNYRALARLGNVSDKVIAVADAAARAGAIKNLRRRRTIRKRLKQVEDEVNGTVSFVMKRVSRVIIFGLLFPVLILTCVVALSGGVGFDDAIIYTVNNLTRGLFLDALEVFDINLLGTGNEPSLSGRLLTVFVILRFTAEATFWFSLASALGALMGSLRMRVPGLRPQSIEQLNVKLHDARDELART